MAKAEKEKELLDKNGRLFGKFSVVDLFAVILIIGVVLGSVYRFAFNSAFANDEDFPLNYTVKINGVRDLTYDFYVVGTPVYERYSGKKIGTIKSVRQEPYMENFYSDDGEVLLLGKPGIITIYIEVETRGFETEKGYYTDEWYELKVGSQVHFYFKHIDVRGTIDSINFNNSY